MATSRIHSTIHVHKDTLATGFYLTGFMFLLSISYLWFVVPVYGGMGFGIDINAVKIFEAVLLLFVSYPIVQRHQQLIGGQFLGLLYAFFIPSTLCYYMLVNQPRIYIYSIVGGFILTVLATRIFYNLLSQALDIIQDTTMYQLTHLSFSLTTFYGRALDVFIASSSLLVFGSLLYHNGPPETTALNLMDVYEVRGTTVYGSAVITYLASWQANVVNPFLITMGLHKRKALLFTTGVSLQLLLYLYTAHKSYLFVIPLIVLVYILVSNRALFTGLLKTFNLVILSSLVLFLVFGSRFLGTLFIRRVFFIPPLIRSGYFDFFTENPHIKMGGTSLESLWSTPYEQHVSYLIGEIYLNGANANIGYLSSAFADFGLLGVIVFAILTGVVLSLIDLVSEGMPVAMVAGIWVVPVFNLDASRLTTTLLTHGLFCALLITILLQERQRHAPPELD